MVSSNNIITSTTSHIDGIDYSCGISWWYAYQAIQDGCPWDSYARILKEDWPDEEFPLVQPVPEEEYEEEYSWYFLPLKEEEEM